MKIGEQLFDENVYFVKIGHDFASSAVAHVEKIKVLLLKNVKMQF